MARKPTQHVTYDISLVRAAAAGRWPEILAQLGGIDAAILDGQGHSCPKCGGEDRFHAITSDDKGGAICRQCFNTKNGDGFSVLTWIVGGDFKSSLVRIAEYLNVSPSANGSSNGSSKHGGGKGKNADPAANLEFQDWNDQLVGLWALNKPPITADAVRAAGGRLAKYRKRWNVVAIPSWGPKLAAAPPIGWVLFHITGGPLPRFQGKEIAEWITTKATYGSKPGLMISGVGEGMAELPTADLVWKVEGATDFLAVLTALLSHPTPPNHRVTSNTHGTDEDPRKSPWMLDLFSGQNVVTIHDSDTPGQRGALTWAATIATTAATSRRATLPYPITESHGRDVRDYLQEGHTYADLLELADAAETVDPGDIPESAPTAATGDSSNPPNSPPGGAATTSHPTPEQPGLEDEKDPHRLARIFAAERPPFRFWRQEWWQYDGRRYEVVEKDELKALVNSSIKREFDRLAADAMESYNARPKSDNDSPPTANWVTQQIVSNVIGALAGMTVSPGRDEMHTWIEDEKAQRRGYIAMQNGILDLDALMSGAGNELLPHDPRWFSSVCLPYAYDPVATCPKWHAFLQKNLEGDPERISILQEWAGYLLTPNTDEQKFMILEGEGQNGKSVYSAAITGMLGTDNVSHVPLECFSKSFDLTETLSKLANIIGDVGELDAVAEGRLKSFTSGDTMFFDRKGIKGVSKVPTARLMMACNNRPRFKDRSQGIARRMIPVPFNRQILPHEIVRGMDKPAWWLKEGELPGIFCWAVVGLHRLRQQGGFSFSKAVELNKSDFEREMNPARAFLKDSYAYVRDEYEICSDVYNAYKTWCKDNGFHPINSANLGREVSRAFPKVARLKRSHDGSRSWAYVHLSTIKSDVQEGDDNATEF